MTEDPSPRRRAPAMTPEQRREEIITAAVPLLVNEGGNVTTGQIAAAAGIAEGTVFRAFKDKQELLVTCMRRGMQADDVVAKTQQISLELPLNERLATAIDLVTGFMQRMWSLMQALQAAGIKRDAMARHHDEDCEDDEKRSPGDRRPEGMIRLTNAMVRLFEPERDRLRLSPELAARLLTGFVFANRLQGEGFGDATAEPAELVELFLHGALQEKRATSTKTTRKQA
ncbi:MAG: TetR family transcriptional regulator [Pseudonocardiaceae bacterium]|nr:TetR family transcriptional regulator [Pseudonocardiaceae bacterium]